MKEAEEFDSEINQNEIYQEELEREQENEAT